MSYPRVINSRSAKARSSEPRNCLRYCIEQQNSKRRNATLLLRKELMENPWKNWGLSGFIGSKKSCAALMFSITNVFSLLQFAWTATNVTSFEFIYVFLQNRGMIGLGNGRKRSKKYEEYVLDKRNLLRTEYTLCEKAAQKLLGYSINFLYKKLRTNPQVSVAQVFARNWRVHCIFILI